MGIQRIFTRNKQKRGEVVRRKGRWVKTGAYEEINPKPTIHPRHLRKLAKEAK